MFCGNHAQGRHDPQLWGEGPDLPSHPATPQLGGADWVALFRLLQQAKARAMAGKKLALIQGIGSIPDSVLFVCFVLNL